MVPTALETLILLIESMIRLLEEVSLPRARLFGLPLPFSNPAARATADIRRIAEALRAIAAERATQFQPPAPQAPPPAPQARIPSPEMARKLPPYPNKSPTPPKAALLFHGLVPALPDFKQNNLASHPSARLFHYDSKTKGSKGPVLGGSRPSPGRPFLFRARPPHYLIPTS